MSSKHKPVTMKVELDEGGGGGGRGVGGGRGRGGVGCGRGKKKVGIWFWSAYLLVTPDNLFFFIKILSFFLKTCI